MSQGKFLAGLLREMSIDPTNLSVDVVPDNAKSSLVVSTTRSRPPSRQTSFCSSQAIQHQQKHHHTVSSNNNNINSNSNGNGNGNCSSISYANCDGVDKNGSILLPGSSSPSWSSSSSSSSSTSTTRAVPPSSPPLQSVPYPSCSIVAAKDKNPLVSHDAGKKLGGGGGDVGSSSSSNSNTFEYHHRDVSASSPIMPISRLTLQSRKQRKLRERWGNGESSSMSSNSCCSSSSSSSNIDGSAATTRRRTTTPSFGKALLPQRDHRHQWKPTMSRSFSDITDQNIHPQDRILYNTVLPTSASSMPLSQPRRKLSLTEEELQSMMLPLSSSACTDTNLDESLDVTDIEHRAPLDEEVGSDNDDDDDDDFNHTTAEEELHDQRQSQSRRVAKEIVTVKMMSRFSQSDSCLTGTTAMSTNARMPVRRRSIEPSDGDFDPSTDGNDGSDASINLDIINRAIHELTTHDE